MAICTTAVESPAHYLRQWCRREGLDAAGLSDLLGCGADQASDLLAGTQPITDHTALALEWAIGIPAAAWTGDEVCPPDTMRAPAARRAPSRTTAVAVTVCCTALLMLGDLRVMALCGIGVCMLPVTLSATATVSGRREARRVDV